MANIRWFVLIEMATGRRHDIASIDMDDPDTALDEATGKPYSLSGKRGISHPAHSAELGYEAVEVPFNPQIAPPDDPDGRYEVDAAAYLSGDKGQSVKAVSGTENRRRRLLRLREQVSALESDMAARNEPRPR